MKPFASKTTDSLQTSQPIYNLQTSAEALRSLTDLKPAFHKHKTYGSSIYKDRIVQLPPPNFCCAQIAPHSGGKPKPLQ